MARIFLPLCKPKPQAYRAFSRAVRVNMPFATINNHKLNYTDIAASGSEDAPQTLILVHGLGSTQNYYFPILPYLNSFRCIVFDNYGAGRSKFQGGETSIPLIAKDVAGLMDHLKIPKAIIVGYSMGGMVPTYMAATSPERVIGGVCIGPVHPTSTIAEAFQKRVSTVQSDGMEAMANTIPNAATGSKATPLHKAFIREMLMAQDADGYIANCKAIQTATPPDYEKVKCPILIIAGEEDKSAPLSGCEKIFSGLGTGQNQKSLNLLPGVGHWLCVEASESVGPLVQKFCGQIKP